MNIDEFWNIISKGKSSEESTIIIRNELKKLPSNEIKFYQQHFNHLIEQAYCWDLWGAAYIIEGGCSDDSFLYFRYGLIAKGKEVYENALNNPDSLAMLGAEVDIENELFGYVAQQVYEELIGREMPINESGIFVDPVGKEWDFDDKDENSKRLPLLSRLYE